MKKIVLNIAVCVALLIGGTSCKNSSTTGPNSKMECWEYTITYGSDGDSYSGYIWNTEDYMEYFKVSYTKYGNVVEYKKSTKYKTVNDCVDAGCLHEYVFG